MWEELKKKAMARKEFSEFLKIGDSKGNTFLHDVAISGDVDFAKLLIKAGSDVDAKNNEGNPPLALAISANQSNMVQTLLSLGAEFDNIYFERKHGPLHLAASYGRPDIVELLVNAYADVNAVDELQLTPMHVVMSRVPRREVIEGDLCRIIKILIEAGADLSAEDSERKTPLRTVFHLSLEGFDLMLNMRPEIRKQIDDKFLKDAVSMESLDKLNRLVELGIDIGAAGSTCLHDALLHSNNEIVQFLLKNNVNMYTLREDLDPLCYALKGWAEAYSEDIMDEKDILIGDGKEIYHRQMKCLKIILDNGYDVNHFTEDRTPLYTTLNNHKVLHSNFVYTLLMNGAKLDFHHPAVRVLFADSYESTHARHLLSHVAIFEADNRKDGSKNFDVNNYNKTCREYYEKCQDELKLMKKTKIDDTNVTFFDVLVERDVSLYTRNESVKNTLMSDTENVSKKFPIYSDLMFERFSEKVQVKKMPCKVFVP